MPAQPEQQAPPVQRLRVRYAKRGRARFTSSRDFGRAFERALRRAGVPMAYSSGFSPHPRISYANAAPTGAASEAEFCEIGLSQVCDPERVRVALDAALPLGLDVVQVVPAAREALADRLTGSRWRIRVAGLTAEVIDAAITTFLACEGAVVARMTKNGLRDVDARAALVALARAGEGELELLTRHLVPLVRPDDVLAALSQQSPQFAPVEAPVITRLAQGRLSADGLLSDPLTDDGSG